MGASYFPTVRHKDLDGEGLAPYVWGIKQQHNAMSTQVIFAADMKEMMNNWNELMRRAAEYFPNDTEEQRFQRVSAAMTQSITGA